MAESGAGVFASIAAQGRKHAAAVASEPDRHDQPEVAIAKVLGGFKVCWYPVEGRKKDAVAKTWSGAVKLAGAYLNQSATTETPAEEHSEGE